MPRMMLIRARRAAPWVLVALLVCGLTVAVLAPAAWLVPQFSRASGGRINLVEPSGSIWQGSAKLTLASGADAGSATLLPGVIAWRTEFLPLLSGRLRMHMRNAANMRQEIVLDATRGETTLSPGSMTVPATLLTGLGAPFNTLDLQGDLRLDWTGWRLAGTRTFGQFALALTDMASRVSRVRPLGSYEVVYDALGDSATLALTTRKGPLLLDGKGERQGSRFSFSGVASSAPGAQDALLGLLSLLGRPLGNGRFELLFNQ
jgi:general secretion pathway protein N